MQSHAARSLARRGHLCGASLLAAAGASGAGWGECSSAWSAFPSAAAAASCAVPPHPSAAAAAAQHVRCFHASPPARSAQDHYKVLGVSKGSAKADIKKQYYKLAKQYHPDTSGDTSKATSEMFTKVQSAWEVLGDDKARKEYDARSSFSSSSSAYSNGGGMHPESRDYSYYAWSTRSGMNARGPSSRSSASNDYSSAWEYVDDDDDDLSEEELFADLFGGAATFEAFARGRSAGRSARGATSSTKAKPKRTPRSRAAREQAEREQADDASAARANASPRQARAARPRKVKPVAGQDLSMSVPLTFVEACTGTTKTISFQADGVCKPCAGTGIRANSAAECRSCNGKGIQNMRMAGHSSGIHIECDKCEGTGTHESSCSGCGGTGFTKEKRTVEVTIPAGVDADTNIRLLHQGHAGKRGGAHGHLLLKTSIAPHALFTRSGFDLHCEHSLPLTTALLGGVAQVPGLDGSMHQVRVAQGTQHMSQLSIPGRGVRILAESAGGAKATAAAVSGASVRGGHAYGSQHVTFKVDLPTFLSPRSKDLLKQLALEMGNIHQVDLSADTAALRREREEREAEEAFKLEAQRKMQQAREQEEGAAAGTKGASASTKQTSTTATSPAASAAKSTPASFTSSFSATHTVPPLPRPVSATAGFTMSTAFASFAAATAEKRAAAAAAAQAASVAAQAQPAKAAAASAASAAASSTASPRASSAPTAAAAAASSTPVSEPVLGGVMDKRARRKLLKRALKAKEHRHALHIDPLSATATQMTKEEATTMRTHAAAAKAHSQHARST